ncbi:hypothetical protein UFOVP1244_20 [uncultured Caudovirales phage]|uniref:Conjugal transfer protein TrbJ n=1 Tax=uncultured Caudovirales phage TaxID=2100421 RepID=A0A6J5RKR7_9CAUD|nr:hypothetical protein UFOVP1244_20 [uncultured Caudovirales phage]
MKMLTVLATVSFIALSSPAGAVIPVTDHAAIAQDAANFVKTSVWQAKEIALEAQQYLVQAESYANAVQNTINLNASAVALVRTQYYRVLQIAQQAQAIAGPDGTMMQRLNMIRSVGGQAGQFPGGAQRSVEWWDQQRRAQLAENAKLLGLEDQRRAVADEMLKAASANGNGAVGQVQAMTSINQTMQANASQVALLNDQMRRQFQYEIEKDEDQEAKNRDFATHFGNYEMDASNTGY